MGMATSEVEEQAVIFDRTDVSAPDLPRSESRITTHGSSPLRPVLPVLTGRHRYQDWMGSVKGFLGIVLGFHLS